MRYPIVSTLLVLALQVGANSHAHADLIEDFNDIQFWVGSGTNESAFVIDWNDGRSPLAWGYRWDGAATGESMLRAIDSADSRFFSTLTFFGGNDYFVEALGYDRDGDGFSTGDADDSFGQSGDFVTDFRFWEYFTAESSPYASSGTWGEPEVGISDRQLTNGSWDGFRFDDTFPGPSPSQPIAAVPAAVPEPSTLVLLGASMISIPFVSRIHRRRSAQ